MDIEHALLELAHEGHAPAEQRQRILALLCPAFDADVGLYVAHEGGGEVRSVRGLGGAGGSALEAAWRAVEREIRPVAERAARDGAATDREVLGAALTRTRLFREVMTPLGGTETLLAVPTVRGRPLGLLALGRCGGRFSHAAVARVAALVPTISVAHRAASASCPALPRLTVAELDLLDLLELGWGTRQIAVARGTSFFTVRNQLAVLYRKLDVTNRAEAIGARRGAGSAR